MTFRDMVFSICDVHNIMNRLLCWLTGRRPRMTDNPSECWGCIHGICTGDRYPRRQDDPFRGLIEDEIRAHHNAMTDSELARYIFRIWYCEVYGSVNAIGNVGRTLAFWDSDMVYRHLFHHVSSLQWRRDFARWYPAVPVTMTRTIEDVAREPGVTTNSSLGPNTSDNNTNNNSTNDSGRVSRTDNVVEANEVDAVNNKTYSMGPHNNLTDEPYDPKSNHHHPGEKPCIVCLDNKRKCSLVPCGHHGFCFACATEIYTRDAHPTCPICRVAVKSTMAIFDV